MVSELRFGIQIEDYNKYDEYQVWSWEVQWHEQFLSWQRRMKDLLIQLRVYKTTLLENVKKPIKGYNADIFFLTTLDLVVYEDM